MDKANKGRGLITVVVVLALIAFLGFSLVPILDSILKGNQAQSRSTSNAYSDGGGWGEAIRVAASSGEGLRIGFAAGS
jgi:hypothetical protein